jgi:HEPN domain-containing protein
MNETNEFEKIAVAEFPMPDNCMECPLMKDYDCSNYCGIILTKREQPSNLPELLNVTEYVESKYPDCPLKIKGEEQKTFDEPLECCYEVMEIHSDDDTEYPVMTFNSFKDAFKCAKNLDKECINGAVINRLWCPVDEDYEIDYGQSIVYAERVWETP